MIERTLQTCQALLVSADMADVTHIKKQTSYRSCYWSPTEQRHMQTQKYLQNLKNPKINNCMLSKIVNANQHACKPYVVHAALINCARCCYTLEHKRTLRLKQIQSIRNKKENRIIYIVPI